MPPNVSLVIPELLVLALPKGEAKGDDGFEAALAAVFPMAVDTAEATPLVETTDKADADLPVPTTRPAIERPTDAILAALAAMFIPGIPIQTPPTPIPPEEAETRNVRSSATPAFTPDVDRRGQFAPESSGDDAGLGFGQSPTAATGKAEAGPAFRADGPGDESVPLPAAPALPEAKGFVAALTPTLDPTPAAADKSTVMKPESPREVVKPEDTALKPETNGQNSGRSVVPGSRTTERTPPPDAPVEGAALPTTPGPPSNKKPLAESAGVVTEVTSRAGGEQARVDRSAVEKLVRKPTTGKDEPPMPPVSPTPPATVEEAAAPVRQAETTPIARLPEPLRLMVMTVRGAVGRGEHEVRLQLQPESLGRVEAQLRYGDGEVQIHLAADSAQTGALLQSHTSELRAALAGAGLAVGQLLVTVSDGRPQSRQPFFERDETAARQEPAGPSAPPSVTAAKSSKIDYRV